jgi:hypothetical protein
MAKTESVAEVAARRYWRERDARVVVEAWRNSGESVAAFARRHHVERRRVAWWAGRIEGSAPAPVRFHPVRLAKPDDGGGAPIEIHFGGGQRVRVFPGFQTDDLRRVVAVLDGRRSC